MGRFDDLTADLPASNSGGRFDDLTSDLPPPEPSFGQKANVYMGMANELASRTPWAVANRGFKNLVGDYAGYLGEHTKLPPKLIAAAELPVAMAPELISSFSGLGGLKNSETPIIKGLMNTPRELGNEYAAQDMALGVDRTTPLEGGRNPTYETPERLVPTKQPKPLEQAVPLQTSTPVRYPSKPSDFFSYAESRLNNAPEHIQPQELMDWNVKLQTDMNNGTIPKYDNDGNITTAYAQASDIKNRASTMFKQIADANLPMLKQEGALPEGISTSRSGLDAANRYAKIMQHPIANLLPAPVMYALKKYGPSLLEGVGVGAGIRAFKQ